MNILKSIFSADGEWSSKRLIGVLGLIVILACYVYCCITNKQLPSVTEFLSGCFVTLLGIDPACSVVKTLKDNTSTNENE